MLNRPDLYEFVRIGELAETITQLLALNLQHGTDLGAKPATGQRVGHIETMVLQQARKYVATIKEGFTLSARTTQVNDRMELRYLLDLILREWQPARGESTAEDDWGEGTSASASVTNEREPLNTWQAQLPTHELLAFGMAAVALGYLPRLPAEKITFPYSYSQPPTYADIPAPKTAGELLWRIEEVERTVGQVMSGELQELVNRRYGQLRRTYGFFEASAHLARQESERFGVKKPQQNFSFF
ncbi:MAG: hypothetical protein U0175_36625 [Caldilineaceae bacterium]